MGRESQVWDLGEIGSFFLFYGLRIYKTIKKLKNKLCKHNFDIFLLQ
jgi:hypothetical protein